MNDNAFTAEHVRILYVDVETFDQRRGCIEHTHVQVDNKEMLPFGHLLTDVALAIQAKGLRDIRGAHLYYRLEAVTRLEGKLYRMQSGPLPHPQAAALSAAIVRAVDHVWGGYTEHVG